MSSILEDLYFGRISPWENKPVPNAGRNATSHKIEAENRYFIEKMSLDDCARYQALNNLYAQEHTLAEVDVFSQAFALGMMMAFEAIAYKGHTGLEE